MDIKGYINTRRKSLAPVGRPPEDSNACPTFIAYAMEDSYVDASYDLEELIESLISDKSSEDVVIWESGSRIVVVIVDGKVTRFGDGK